MPMGWPGHRLRQGGWGFLFKKPGSWRLPGGSSRDGQAPRRFPADSAGSVARTARTSGGHTRAPWITGLRRRQWAALASAPWTLRLPVWSAPQSRRLSPGPRSHPARLLLRRAEPMDRYGRRVAALAACGYAGFPCWWSPPGGSTNKGNRSSGRDRWILSHCSTLDVVDGSQQAAQTVVGERDPDGRPLLWLDAPMPRQVRSAAFRSWCTSRAM
jgi:hypothetical protein